MDCCCLGRFLQNTHSRYPTTIPGVCTYWLIYRRYIFITVWMFCTVCTDATAGETLDTTELAFADSRWSPVSHVTLRRKAKLPYTIECLVNDQSVSEREERTTGSQEDTSWTGSIVDDSFGLFTVQLGQFSHFRIVLYLTSNYEKSIK